MVDLCDDMCLFLMDLDVCGILLLDDFYVLLRLCKMVWKNFYCVIVDIVFNCVIEVCVELYLNCFVIWINDVILNLYGVLYWEGYVYSVECWDDVGDLVGGLYGVFFGGVFFGESMFLCVIDVFKIVLVYFVVCLCMGGYGLFDV